MSDQQTLKFSDVIRNAGGISAGGDSLFADQVFLRGLQLGSRDFRKDGFLDPTFVPRDFQNVERVEVLKGPASVLYGSSSPAGMVNLITKKPLDARFVDANVTLGSFEQQRYTLDANGYATQSGNVLYRVNVAHEDSNTFKDFAFMSRTLVAPSITFKLNDETRLTYQAEYHNDHRRGDQGIPVVGGNPLALPPERYVGEPANDFLHTEEFRQSLVLTKELNEDWTFSIGGSSLFYQFPGSVTAASGNPVPGFFPDVPEPFFYRSRTDILQSDEQAHSLVANLAGDFHTGELRHQSLVGFEFAYLDSNSSYAYGAVNPIDVTNPVYLNPPTIPLGAALFPAYRQQRVGSYVQDLVHLNDYWKALGGARFDTVDLDFDRTLIFGAPVVANTNQNFDRITPRAGLVYQPFGDESLAYYFNYSQSFSPPGGGVYLNTGGLRPVTGETFEGGIKTMLVDGLTFNVAGFHTVRKNADLNTSSFFLVQVGEERSQGVEMNLLGQVTERLSAVVNYTYADVRLYDPLNPTFDGNRQRNVPFNSANLWSRFNLVQTDEQTFGAGLGLVYSDSRPGDLTNSFELPHYSRWDAGLFYNRGRFYTNLFIENLFDVNYAASSINNFQVFPGAPVNGRVLAGITF
jgi:iron complex outermembrane receptor protein